MSKKLVMLSMIAAAGLACPAMAQDSVSRNSDGGNGLPGDALSPWTTGTPFQRANYVVDMDTFFTSRSTVFGIAPIFKSAKTNSANFNSLFSGSSISQTIRSNAPYAAGSYLSWSSPTAGVNPTQNNTGLNSVESPVGTSTAFGAIMAEFGTSDTFVNANNIIGAMVNYDPANPSRLYVQRNVVAVNSPDGVQLDSSQFGVGAVDAHGNVHFRADGFGAAGPNAFTGNNYFRVGQALRNPASVNFFSSVGSGGSDAAATRWLTVNSVDSVNTPTIIPTDLATRPVLLGSDFLIQFRHEKVANAMTSEPPAAHLGAPATDQRGGVSFSPRRVLGGTGVGTCGMLGKSTADTDAICLWSVNANGDILNKTTFVRPAAFVDPCDAFTFTGVFDGYRSQVAARGGNGMVAIAQDQQGRGLAAAVVYNSGIAQNPWNGIAVVRFNPANPGGTAAWTLAAWNDSGNFTGKDLTGDYGADGIAFTGDAGEFDGVVDATDGPIGRLASAFEVSGTLVGPSMSSPAFDAAGNIYFMSAVALNKADAAGVPFTDFDFALVRGIYNPATFCYDLELVLEPGDRFDGLNSGTRYQVTFLDVLDSNSVSSGTLFSQNVTAATWNNEPVDPNQEAAKNLGGLVIGAKIVYDVDGDGDFSDPTSSGGDPLSADEGYNVLLYIGYPGEQCGGSCPADFNGDGFVSGDDFDQYVAAFELGDITADFNCDGFVSGDDFDLFVAAFEVGC